MRESAEDEIENKPNYGTLTLKRKKEEKERDVKMEQLRKKLKTDDEGTAWNLKSRTKRNILFSCYSLSPHMKIFISLLVLTQLIK